MWNINANKPRNAQTVVSDPICITPSSFLYPHPRKFSPLEEGESDLAESWIMILVIADGISLLKLMVSNDVLVIIPILLHTVLLCKC